MYIIYLLFFDILYKLIKCHIIVVIDLDAVPGRPLPRLAPAFYQGFVRFWRVGLGTILESMGI